MKKIIVALITTYQRTVSPDHGLWARPHGHCPYWPSCSEYAKQAIERYGVLHGTWLALLRIGKCRPGRLPTVDPLH